MLKSSYCCLWAECHHPGLACETCQHSHYNVEESHYACTGVVALCAEKTRRRVYFLLSRLFSQKQCVGEPAMLHTPPTSAGLITAVCFIADCRCTGGIACLCISSPAELRECRRRLKAGIVRLRVVLAVQEDVTLRHPPANSDVHDTSRIL